MVTKLQQLQIIKQNRSAIMFIIELATTNRIMLCFVRIQSSGDFQTENATHKHFTVKFTRGCLEYFMFMYAHRIYKQ